MPQSPLTMQDVFDRLAIQEVIARYFQALDRCDAAQVRSCFTEDMIASYDGRQEVRGIDAFLATMRTFQRQRTGEAKVTTHFMGNLNFCSLEADMAETETNCIAHLVLVTDQGDEVAVRSLRYLDRLRRTVDGWRISERIHTLDWSYQMPATFATTLVHRKVMHLPAR